MTHFVEVNFDGMVGPTHSYAGLSVGNIASSRNQQSVSHPRAAALQGLAKMKTLHDRGLLQAVLPPLERPTLHDLWHFGFTGSNAEECFSAAACEDPKLFAALLSASSMWTANAATVNPSPDAPDKRVHFTPANLFNKLHRALETRQTAYNLKRIFSDPVHFTHHAPLAGGLAMSDEGAANHTRLCLSHGGPGVHLFVYGRSGLQPGLPEPTHYPARQTIEASQAIARRHGIPADQVVFAQQTPDAIDAGVFHNDVISVGSQSFLFVHEQAYLAQASVLEELRTVFERVTGGQLHITEVPTARVSLLDAVSSYLFNSQLLDDGKGGVLLLAPEECRENERIHNYLEELLASKECPITEVLYLNLRESMRNGGGPACLRLRVVLSEQERRAITANLFLNDSLYGSLTSWVERHYRESLHPSELHDPALWRETQSALDELTTLLHLPRLYEFQNL
ncbi:MAG: N-succinylarginine dihydrolase [Verrucomicrobiota bacterium]|nr:N-succinylarginine dihydrolase [Verrucomicrobiota bacterium]